MKLKQTIALSIGLTFSYLMPFTVSAVQAKTYAMVIGIDTYQYEEPLDGAINDANDIQNALRQNGIHNIRVFKNRRATKQAIKAQWNIMLRNTKAGDTLIVTYSGHGIQIKDYSGDEPDGLDEAMALSGYNVETTGSNRQNLILDDEWHQMFSKAKGRQIIFVVDACHAGTLNKGILRNVFKQRSFPVPINHTPEPIIDNQKVNPKQDLKNVLTLFATVADKKVREVEISGQRRGLLSWAFANGMRGKADANKDGNISRKELSDYITIAVRKIMPSQLPQFTPRGAFNSNQTIFPSAKKLSALSKELTISLSPIGTEHVNFLTTGNTYPYLTLYNVTQNGTVQFLYPQSSGETNMRHKNAFSLKLKVDRRFTGNEQIIAIYSERPQLKFHHLLKQLHNKPNGIRQLNAQKNRLLKGKIESKELKHTVSR